MKDLIKGHNPLTLFFVALVSLFFAFAARNKIVGEGHTDLNANFFFFMILASSVGCYFLIHEGIKEFTFFSKKSWKKRGITPQSTTSKTIASVETVKIDKETSAKEHQPLTREDARMLLTEILAVKSDKASDSKEEIVKGINDNMLDLSNVAANAADEIEAGLQRTFQEACLYTIEVLGAYMTKEHMELLINRLSKFQRAGNHEWTVPSNSETIDIKVETQSPISKTDLYHYGWNMQQLFGKTGRQAAYFLQSTFRGHFDGLLIKTIKGKLTNDPLKGIIKIDKNFSPNYRSRLDREKEKNLRQMTKELEEEQKQLKFEAAEARKEKVAKSLESNKPSPISQMREVPMPPLTIKKEESTMDFDDIEDDDEEIREEFPKDSYENEEDYWEDTNDEPTDDEFIFAMLERSAKRNQKINEPEPWKTGDSLVVDRDW